MQKVKMINVDALPNIPWQERPGNLKTESPVWRYSENPVMGRNPTPEIARIFNSAVVPWKDGFIAVLRGEQINGIPYVYLGHSKDGIHWDVERQKVPFTDENGNPKMPHYAYDPRLVKVEDTYYIIWCGDFFGASIGMAKTKDFKTFTRIENPFIPFNRNGAVSPQNQRDLPAAEPSLRQRTYSFRRYLYQRKPRHDILGEAPPRDGQRRRMVGERKDRRRRGPDRDQRRMADVLPRRGYNLQRLCLFHGCRDSGH